MRGKLYFFVCAFFFFSNPVSAQDIAMYYWGAEDCGPCKAWERQYESDVSTMFKEKGYKYVRVYKKSIRHKYKHTDTTDPIAKKIIDSRQSPQFTPAFTYAFGMDRLFDIIGTREWKKHHSNYVAVLESMKK